MQSLKQIGLFLTDFKQKLLVFGVFFIHRDKNIQTLLDLEITSLQRVYYLQNLTVEDYSEGPNDDLFDPESPPNYIFGITINGKEIYIKINLGKPQKSVMCISFHISDIKMKYPFKEKDNQK